MGIVLAHSTPAPWVLSTLGGLDSAELWKSWKLWIESKRGAEQPAACPALPTHAVIDRYPVAPDSPSGNLELYGGVGLSLPLQSQG